MFILIAAGRDVSIWEAKSTSLGELLKKNQLINMTIFLEGYSMQWGCGNMGIIKISFLPDLAGIS